MSKSAVSSGIEFEDGLAREPLTLVAQERTAHYTHSMGIGARLLFLFSHGILVYTVSSSLNKLSEVSWWAVFLPVWLGDGLIFILLILSWFASCPYMKLCIAERSQRVGSTNPSLLTEILPDIVLAIFGSIFVLLVFFAELAFCAYLGSVQRGQPYSLATSVSFISFVAILAICRGVLITDDSIVFIAVGVGVFTSMLTFAITRGMTASSQAVALVPFALAVAGLLVAGIHNLGKIRKVLTREERILRVFEIIALMVMLFSALASTSKVRGDVMTEASSHGIAAGVSMCAIAALRGRMYCLELRSPVTERIFAQRREAMSGNLHSVQSEVQISLRSSQHSLA